MNRSEVPRHSRPELAGGFTLIELVIVIAVVAILAVLAVNSYRSTVVKARRTAAKGCVQEGAQSMERFYTLNLKYTGASLPVCSSDVTQYYTLQFNGSPDSTTYIVQAVPQGAQSTDDANCGTLAIDQTGTKTISGTSTVAECW